MVIVQKIRSSLWAEQWTPLVMSSSLWFLWSLWSFPSLLYKGSNTQFEYSKSWQKPIIFSSFSCHCCLITLWMLSYLWQIYSNQTSFSSKIKSSADLIPMNRDTKWCFNLWAIIWIFTSVRIIDKANRW